MAALFIFIIAGTPTGDASLRWTARALAGVLLVLLLVWHTRRRYYLPQTKSHRPTKVWRLPDYQVNILQRSAGHSNALTRLNEADSARARIFTSAIIFPASVRQRITERYEPGQRTLMQRVTIDAQLSPRVVRKILHPDEVSAAERRLTVPAQRSEPSVEFPPPHGAEHGVPTASAIPDSNGQSVILFPVLVPLKGEMVDNLRVLAADGSALPILSYRQYLQLVAQVLRTMLDIAYGRDISAETHGEAFKAEQLALRAVMRRAEIIDKDDDDSGSHELSIVADADVGPEVVNEAALTLAAQLVKKLTSHYAVVAAVPCPPDGRFVVSYERMMTPALELAPLSKGILNWMKARARLVFGSRPVDFAISLDSAWTTQSYHLVIDAQDGVFVGVQESTDLLEYLTAHWNRVKGIRKKRARNGQVQQAVARGESSTEATTPPPYYRFRRRAGQRYAHFYTRFFPEPIEELPRGNRVPEVRFRFYEVPPGSVFRAVITGCAAALLIWLIGFVASRKADPGTDVPAFLLVFPAVAAAWLGFDGQPRRLLEGTLAARISLVTTALCSIAASGLFMVYKANLLYFRWDNFFDMRILGIKSLAWSGLTLVAILNATSIGYIYLARSWEFMHLSSRPNTFGGPKEIVD
ncbi:hypothetical protein U2F26_11845 [Micromonospora sp. 4G57]|uniref:Uncharacterized protein n=1 Tax=Micromonospora sicca TaxID=2202420 RepID=A0ABU5J662_9ACTN|nr:MULTISPECIES: hypothetical protein [unclassified Micromonospora]MDZ5443420.1 hypothetical protein [Micromonospora sp. 4G57]MDZ5488080.1 hypothetical protein [Micromonospora sp. 4G53]